MRFSVRVYCSRLPALSRADLAQFVEDGVYVDPDPRFDPAPGTAAAGEPDWEQLRIQHSAGRAPISVRRVTDPQRVAEDVTRARSEHTDDPLAGALSGVTCLFVLTLDEDEVGDSDAWQLVDDLAHHVAQEGHGVIGIPGMELGRPS
jgi:hypothetical protein